MGTINFTEKWYHPGSVYGPVNVVQLTDDNHDGVIDAYDDPDLVFPENGNLTALDGKSGNVLWVSQGVVVSNLGSPASADIDGDGMVEIVIVNNNRTKLHAFEHDGTLKWSVNTGPAKSDEPRDAVAIADIDHDGDVEIIHGRRAYDHTGALLWEGTGDYGGETAYGTLPIIADLDGQGAMEIIAGRTAYRANGSILWHRSDLPATGGFTAIGNFNQDENPEIVLVAGGRVYLLDNLGRTIWGPVTLPGGGTGGAPTVGDFDGDGQPEIGIAGATRYVVLETNGAVKWTSPTQDASSHRTGSSLFDFNLDGKAEVAYADELYLRIYDGATGNILKQQRVGSGTTLEYPVIADIDADGKAEIVVGSNDSRYSSRPGLLVYEDVQDNWAPTRSIWNQHSYHIDNIDDDGRVPQYEAASWLTHNSYRLNRFSDRDPELLTDITASMLRIDHNHANQTASISVRIGNAGAADLASRISIAFYEGDPTQNGHLLGMLSMDQLASGAFQDVRLDNIVSLGGTADIYVVADPDDRIPECNETNNRVVLPVLPQSALGGISVATNQAVYGPFSPVYLQASVFNTSGVPGEFKAALSIMDDQGAVVKQFDTHAIGLLAGGASQTQAEFWQTEQYQAGIYHLRGQLYDLGGNLIHQHESAFEIRHALNGEPLAALRTTTDKAVYHTTDSAQLFNLVQNLAINRSIDDAVLQINVYNPGGISVYDENRHIGTLTGNGSRDFVSQYSLVQATEGSYTVTGVIKTQTGTVLAQAQAHFEVHADALKQLSGTVQVQAPTLDKGRPQRCTDTLNNTGSQNLAAQAIRQLLVNLETGDIILSTESAVDVPLNAPYSTTRTIDTHNLATGAYACILQQNVNDAWYTLAHQTFVLAEPPVKIEGQLNAGDRGRVLILLDDALKQPPTHGPNPIPDLASQRHTLEAVLTAAGWSYTLAADAETFTRELRSGGYAAYLLLSERIKLDEAVQKELREAVYRGEGLIEAGSHDQRQGRIDVALGVKFRGKHPGMRGIALSPTDWTPAGQADFQLTGHVLKVALDGATASGVFINSKGQSTADTAVTLHTYGQGRSVYIGFDLAAELALAPPDSLFETLLLDALAAVQPAEFKAVAHGTYPLQLTLNNRGIATPGRVQLTLPDGVSVVDAGSAAVESQTLTWPFNLAEAETLTFDAWLKLPAEPVLLSAAVQSGIAPDVMNQAALALELAPDAWVTVESVQQQAASLSGKDYKQVQKYLDWAQADSQTGRWSDALSALLRAADALIPIATPESEALRLQVAKVILGTAKRIE